MGIRKLYENLKHAVTPSSPAETIRHAAAIAAISGSNVLVDGSEMIRHETEVMSENVRHILAFSDTFEDFRHEVSAIGETMTHELHITINDFMH